MLPAIEDSKEPAKFINARCPIEKFNSISETYNTEFEGMFCNGTDEQGNKCPLLTQFPNELNYPYA